jgi:hypothetical protein
MSLPLIISLAAATTAFLWLRSVLPYQNVLAIAGLTAVVSIVNRIGEASIFPAALRTPGESAGELLGAAAGAFAIVVCARGAAKALLWRTRNSPNAGLWIFGLATLLSLIPSLGGWSFMSRMLIIPACLILGTPWFIDKRRVDLPPDFRPLWIWMGVCVAALGLHLI